MANALTKFVKRAADYWGDRSKSINDLISGLFSSTRTFEVDENAVLSITPAWRAISILKDILATMPLNLYEGTADGDVVLREDHPLNKLIAVSPHPLYTPYNWMSAMLVNTLVCGNGISRIIRNGSGIPVALQLLEHGEWNDILIGEDGKHLIYKLRNGGSLHSDDVIHFKWVSVNGMAGLNSTLIHKDTFASEMALRDYVKSFLEKGAFLSGVISHPTMLDDRAYKKLKSSWDNAHGGAGKAGGTAILEGGATFAPIQSTIQQSGYDLVKGASISDISRIYGVPEIMLDAKNKPTYSGAEQIMIDFKKYTLDGWCINIKQELTKKLVSSNQSGRFFFDYDQSGLTTGDINTMGDYYQKLYNMSVLNPDEIRKYIKLNKVPHGDRYMVQGNNMIPVDMIDKILEQKTSPTTANGETDVAADMPTIKE